MESLTLNRTKVEPESESHCPSDLLDLRHESKTSLELVQAMSNVKGEAISEEPAPTLPPKVIGIPPSKKSRTERDPKSSIKEPEIKPLSQTEMPTYGRGSDPSPTVQGTFMDQVKSPVANREQVEMRKRLRKYKEKKQKSSHSTYQQPAQTHGEAVMTTDVNGKCSKVESRPENTFAEQGLENPSHEPITAEIAIAREIKKKPIKQKPDHIVLADDLLNAIFDTFHKLDVHKEQIINREDFITAIDELEIANANLEAIAFVLPEEKKLGEVLVTIEDDGNAEEAEDLTLAQLYNYFQYNYVPSDEKEEDSNAVILEKQDLRLLYNTYSKFVGEGDATNTEQFVNAILEGANFDELRKKIARKQNRKSKFRDETVEELLRRIKKSEGETLTWNIFLAYLTPHGEPQNVEELVEVEEPEPNALVYDSSDSSTLNQTTDEDKSKPPLTVPKPPLFLFRKNNGGIRERKVKEMIAAKEQEESKELSNKFRSQGVDKSILEAKYSQMEEEKQRLREDNREKREQELLASMKPFAVAEKVIQKEMPQQQTLTQFRASEVPETSRLLKWEEIQEEEQRRKEKIAKEAEEKLKQAALPPRMEADLNKPKKSQATVQSKHMFRARSAPDFTALHSKNSAQAQSRPKKVTECEPFALSEKKNCHQPTEDPKPEKSMKEFKIGLETGIKQQKVKQTVLNQMKSQSADQSRKQTFQTEIEEVFTGEMDRRKVSFMNEIEDVLSKTSE